MMTPTFLLGCALLCSLVLHAMAGMDYNCGVSSTNTIESQTLSVITNTPRQQGSKCKYEVLGRGVKDTLEEDCAHDPHDFINICSPKYHAYYYPNHSPFGLYTDTQGTLVIIKAAGCKVRTYQSDSTGQGTNSESDLSKEVCDKIKDFVAEETRQVVVYWKKWAINFKRQMQRLPPAEIIFDPLLNQPLSPSLYADQLGATSTTSGIKNTGSQALQPQPLTTSLTTLPLATTVVPTVSNTAGPTILGQTSMQSTAGKSIDSPSFSLFTNVVNDDNGCTMESYIKGNGVYDCFTRACPEKEPMWVTFGSTMIYGNPDHDPFSAFSDERSTLFLFENGRCSKKTYALRGSEVTSKADILTNEDCASLKKRYKDIYRKNGMTLRSDGSISFDDSSEAASTSTPATAGDEDITTKRIKITTNFPQNTNGQCQVEISVLGNGVKDKLTQTCSDKPADTVSTDDVFIFGDPKENALSLYSNEPNILYVIKNKICSKKTYTTTNGVTVNKQNLMKLAKCSDLRKKMAGTLKRQKQTKMTYPMSPSTVDIGSNDATSSPSGYSPPPDSPTQVVPVDVITPQTTSGTTVGVTWREGGFTDIYNTNFAVNIKYTGNGICSVEVVGGGVNDLIVDQCSVLGENIKLYNKGYMLTVADPTKQSGLFTQTWRALVFLREGQCYSKTYDTKYGEKTKITTELLDSTRCDNVKESMSSMMGMAFGQTPGTSTPNTPMWRPGNYQQVYSQIPDVTVTMNDQGTDGCTVTVKITGRAINDEIKDSCSVLGTNIQKKVTTTSLSISDPASNSGFYSQVWGSLVVIKGGQCSLRKYNSSPITHTTKIIPSAMETAECEKVKEKISGALGVKFGQQ